ncbi:NTP transferase domain-containing protein [Candidatus Poribacteria bacterium]|nr:NTP transferase domain-containing protein [Candidatus Poribacteria bacterium]
MQAVILCGGLATRLGNISKKKPKILLEVGRHTVLDWQLGLLKAVGVKETILASGHLHDMLHEQVGGYREGMHIRYAKENRRLGTGGAIANAMKHIHTFPFFVLNGDVLVTDFSLQDMLDRFHTEMTGLLLSVHVEDVRQYGEIVSDSNGKIRAFREKQSMSRAGYVNGGVYLFNQTIADTFPKHQEIFSIERDVFPSVSDLYALETDATWIDIGVPERLAYARQYFQNGAFQ